MKTITTLLIALAVMAFNAPVIAQSAGLPDFTKLVKRNHEAVVNISTRQKASPVTPSEPSEDGESNPLDELIKRFKEDQPQQQPFEGDGLGSGFIISKDGYVLTNNHVIENADEVIVSLHDRRQLIAKVIGTDPRSDVAVLKLDATDLPVVRIGNSDSLEVGAWVLAIGSPFGFDFSVTAGIVSATGRALPSESYVPFIQTDVAINPGNSGGPLFNLDGEVIGINSQIYSRTGSFMGLSFAIPIELAMDVADQLRTTGQVSRGWLGVIIQEVTMELAESFGMRTAHGALVSSILPRSPASNSSLEVGDVITHFENQRIERSSSLPPLVGRVKANEDAQLRVVRDGKSIELIVNIGELPGNEEIRAANSAPRIADNLLALDVGVLDDATRQQLQVDKGGVVVTQVVEGGPADLAGVLPGDVLLMVDNKAVDTPRQFSDVVGELDDEGSVAVLVQREQGPVFLALKLD
jgi:serine protease Do